MLSYSVIEDAVLRVGEMAARQLYWRSPALQKSRRRFAAPKQPKLKVSESELAAAIGRVMLQSDVVLCHIAAARIEFAESGPLTEPHTASRLLDALLQVAGESATMVLPTYSVLQGRLPPAGQEAVYDPRRTPCWTGWACELFRRRTDVRRSEFPIDSLCARGPLADELFEGELAGDRPAPHGANSAFARICSRNGMIMSIGVPLVEVCSTVHVAEDIHPCWPIKDFYRERRFRIRTGHGELVASVRERRPAFRRNYCEGQLHRDLLRAGLLQESSIRGVRVDWMRAGDCLDFMMKKNRTKPYPYYWANLG